MPLELYYLSVPFCPSVWLQPLYWRHLGPNFNNEINFLQCVVSYCHVVTTIHKKILQQGKSSTSCPTLKNSKNRYWEIFRKICLKWLISTILLGSFAVLSLWPVGLGQRKRRTELAWVNKEVALAQWFSFQPGTVRSSKHCEQVHYIRWRSGRFRQRRRRYALPYNLSTTNWLYMLKSHTFLW